MPFNVIARDWKKITGTSHATPGTTTTHAHGLGRVPVAVQIQQVVGVGVYQAVAADATNISIRSSGVSTAFTAWVA